MRALPTAAGPCVIGDQRKAENRNRATRRQQIHGTRNQENPANKRKTVVFCLRRQRQNQVEQILKYVCLGWRMSAFGRHFRYPNVPQQPRDPLRGALGGQGLIFSGFWGWQGGFWGVALAPGRPPSCPPGARPVIWLTFSIYAGLGLTCEGFLEG